MTVSVKGIDRRIFLCIMLVMDAKKLLEELKQEEDAAKVVMDAIKSRRNELIRRLHDNGNGWSLRRIGEIYGLSAEGVRLIVAKDK